MDPESSSRKVRRLAFMLSGLIDALIGGALLLLGFGMLPVDATSYGFENWHALALGGILFVIGAGTFVYNLSRLGE